MTTAAQDAPKPAAGVRPLWRRMLVWALIVLVIGAAANLFGWDIRGWFHDLWGTVTSISAASLAAAICCMIVQTTATAFAWYSILKFAYPERTRWRDVLAGYAVSVALNGILPANIGTLVLLIMLTVLIGMSFAAVLGAYAVEKIFFTVAGAFVYIYLFLTVGGSFDIKFSWVSDHKGLTALILIGGAVLLVIAIRVIMTKARTFIEKAKDGGEIMRYPRAYFARVFFPQFLGWSAGLAVIAVFLAAYAIPVTFHTVMSVVGGNSLANVTAVTPGSVGVTQAFNVASLNDVTTAQNATAYSIGQQLFTTAWNIVVALVLMVWAFGWTGGKELVTKSYADAKDKAAEQSAAHKARREAKRAEKVDRHG
jgi:uncharacterized membrane protein YbhN (UPF0104 family)